MDSPNTDDTSVFGVLLQGPEVPLDQVLAELHGGHEQAIGQEEICHESRIYFRGVVDL